MYVCSGAKLDVQLHVKVALLCVGGGGDAAAVMAAAAVASRRSVTTTLDTQLSSNPWQKVHANDFTVALYLCRIQMCSSCRGREAAIGQSAMSSAARRRSRSSVELNMRHETLNTH